LELKASPVQQLDKSKLEFLFKKRFKKISAGFFFFSFCSSNPWSGLDPDRDPYPDPDSLEMLNQDSQVSFSTLMFLLDLEFAFCKKAGKYSWRIEVYSSIFIYFYYGRKC